MYFIEKMFTLRFRNYEQLQNEDWLESFPFFFIFNVVFSKEHASVGWYRVIFFMAYIDTH